MHNLLVFGEEYNFEWLNTKTSQEILEEAYLKVNEVSETNIETILDILHKVSNAWANPI